MRVGRAGQPARQVMKAHENVSRERAVKFDGGSRVVRGAFECVKEIGQLLPCPFHERAVEVAVPHSRAVIFVVIVQALLVIIDILLILSKLGRTKTE